MPFRMALLAVMVAALLAGCRAEPPYTIIEGEAVSLLDIGLDSLHAITVESVDGFIDIRDSSGNTYRGFFLPKTEYVALDGKKATTDIKDIIENFRTYRYHCLPRASATVSDKGRQSYQRARQFGHTFIPSAPSDSTKYFDIYRIEQLSDIPLDRMTLPAYEIDNDTTP